MVRIYALAAALVTVGFLGWTGWMVLQRQGAGDDRFAACRQGQTGGADIGGPFSLLDKDGNTVTDQDVLTGPTLVYFGYTFCPDVCPLDMSRNAEVADILEEQGMELNLLFITVDPARDTPQIAGEFADNVHPRATGLSGSPEQIAAAAKAYRVYFKKQDGGDPEFYLVDHSAFSYLMLPGTGFADFYKHGAPADEVAKGAACFLDIAASAN